MWNRFNRMIDRAVGFLIELQRELTHIWRLNVLCALRNLNCGRQCRWFPWQCKASPLQARGRMPWWSIRASRSPTAASTPVVARISAAAWKARRRRKRRRRRRRSPTRIPTLNRNISTCANLNNVTTVSYLSTDIMLAHIASPYCRLANRFFTRFGNYSDTQRVFVFPHAHWLTIPLATEWCHYIALRHRRRHY